ncbi:MAG: hypothetical protein KJ638_07530 [Chloroflexi bacterium]|nr:hypothetical protein [Chloroflexota bacterium]
MNAIREQLNKPIVAGVVGFVVGLIIGWFIIGWGVWPVAWTDAAPRDLHDVWKEDYMRMAIDSYKVVPDADKAKQRWQDLEPGAADVLAAITESPAPQIPEAIQGFSVAVESSPAEVTAPEGETAPEGDDSGSNITILLVMCLVTIVLGGAVAGYFLFIRGRTRTLSPAAESLEYTKEMERTDFSARDDGPPISQFMTTYMIGDDLFDDSFSIDSQTGEFLGECGVGISESIGVGEPKKVAAFEVWLFDKNDIQTVTKVLMSQHAYSDATLRHQLAAKGDPFLMVAGSETVLETDTLRMEARVAKMTYGSGSAPPESFFDKVTLELAVWQKKD